MSSPASTFATLRALHLVIGDALDDIQRVFSLSDTSQCSSRGSPATSPSPPTSFPPTPLSATFPSTAIPFLDYPSPDLPYDTDSTAEQLALHPDAVAASSRIVAACGHISSIVHKPFLSLCDAIMSYNLPACMRLVEHLHIAEIIREAEEKKHCLVATGQAATTPEAKADEVDRISGLHVTDITSTICSHTGEGYVDSCELVHVLRLLSTHHIFRETSPDTFALTRVSSLLDTGKSVETVFSSPETKYDDTDGTAAFVGMITDELFKSSAYLTEAFTGVHLPTPTSTPNSLFSANAILSRTTTNSSPIRNAASDPTSYSPATRPSSVLTHVAYPLTDSPEQVVLPSPSSDHPIPSVELQAQSSSQISTVARVNKSDKFLAFNLAFHTNIPFFEWLENGGQDLLGGTGQGARVSSPKNDACPTVAGSIRNHVPKKSFRLERFSKAMKGTVGWEAPKAILSGFDWCSLPKGSTVVDVGGGIGSTTMVLACVLNNSKDNSAEGQNGDRDEETAIQRQITKPPVDALTASRDELQNNITEFDTMNLRFVVQDRPVVTSLGIEAWRSKSPELLKSGQVLFQDQDFFEPQPLLRSPHLSGHPAVYILRVVLHDWPDELARRILINLRVASNPETRLLIAEHVLPLACPDDSVPDHASTVACEKVGSTREWTIDSVLAHMEGAERTLVSPPMLSNLGKASANAYWMDLIMHITLNGKERTLREFCSLALSAGWRITRMTRPEGTLFAHLVCEPVSLPDDAQAIYNAVALSSELSMVVTVPPDERAHHPIVEPSRYKRLPAVPLTRSPVLERPSSRCGTPTFGSRTQLPKDDELPDLRTRSAAGARKWLKSKGFGVRSVVMQKTERTKQRERNLSKNDSVGDNNQVPTVTPTSSSHVRVWWKKSPSNSASNSTTAIHESSGELPVRAPGRRRRDTLRSNNTPSTPSPRMSPIHQKWPSIESAVLQMPDASPPIPCPRRPSVASITRKLSFATFRKPSAGDIADPLPTPPPSATLLTELAPPPTLQGDIIPRLKHLPSVPTLRHNERTTSTTISRRPSLSFASQIPSPRPIPKSSLPRHPEVIGSPKSGILKLRSSPNADKGCLGEAPTLTTASIPRRQRSVTLSSSPTAAAVPPGTRAPITGGSNVLPERPEMKRIPSIPRMPHRLSIPILRRKRSLHDGED